MVVHTCNLSYSESWSRTIKSQRPAWAATWDSVKGWGWEGKCTNFTQSAQLVQIYLRFSFSFLFWFLVCLLLHFWEPSMELYLQGIFLISRQCLPELPESWLRLAIILPQPVCMLKYSYAQPHPVSNINILHNSSKIIRTKAIKQLCYFIN